MGFFNSKKAKVKDQEPVEDTTAKKCAVLLQELLADLDKTTEPLLEIPSNFKTSASVNMKALDLFKAILEDLFKWEVTENFKRVITQTDTGTSIATCTLRDSSGQEYSLSTPDFTKLNKSYIEQIQIGKGKELVEETLSSILVFNHIYSMGFIDSSKFFENFRTISAYCRDNLNGVIIEIWERTVKYLESLNVPRALITNNIEQAIMTIANSKMYNTCDTIEVYSYHKFINNVCTECEFDDNDFATMKSFILSKNGEQSVQPVQPMEQPVQPMEQMAQPAPQMQPIQQPMEQTTFFGTQEVPVQEFGNPAPVPPIPEMATPMGVPQVNDITIEPNFVNPMEGAVPYAQQPESAIRMTSLGKQGRVGTDSDMPDIVSTDLNSINSMLDMNGKVDTSSFVEPLPVHRVSEAWRYCSHEPKRMHIFLQCSDRIGISVSNGVLEAILNRLFTIAGNLPNSNIIFHIGDEVDPIEVDATGVPTIMNIFKGDDFKSLEHRFELYPLIEEIGRTEFEEGDCVIVLYTDAYDQYQCVARMQPIVEKLYDTMVSFVKLNNPFEKGEEEALGIQGIPHAFITQELSANGIEITQLISSLVYR